MTEMKRPAIKEDNNAPQKKLPNKTDADLDKVRSMFNRFGSDSDGITPERS